MKFRTKEWKNRWGGHLKARFVMVVVQKLVDDQKSRPVGAARKGADLQVENGLPNIK